MSVLSNEPAVVLAVPVETVAPSLARNSEMLYAPPLAKLTPGAVNVTAGVLAGIVLGTLV
jgi:hypothetical protein